jgi:hypothetical protein
MISPSTRNQRAGVCESAHGKVVGDQLIYGDRTWLAPPWPGHPEPNTLPRDCWCRAGTGQDAVMVTPASRAKDPIVAVACTMGWSGSRNRSIGW